MSKRIVTFLVSCLALALPMQAAAGTYIGLDGASMVVKNVQDDELNPRGMRLRFGVRLTEVFDIEMHLGDVSDSESTSSTSFSSAYAGAYLKAYLPVGHRSAVFALAGLSGISQSQGINGRSLSDSLSGFSYGVGMETQLTDRFDLSADFMSYGNDGAEFSDVSAVSLGLKWYF